MSLWTSYRALSTRTRMLIGGGIMTYAVAGMFLSDKAEQFFGFEPTDQDRKRLQDSIPTIHAVDREKPGLWCWRERRETHLNGRLVETWERRGHACYLDKGERQARKHPSKGTALSDSDTSLKELNVCAHGISEWNQQPPGLLKALWYLGARLQEAPWQQTFKSTVAASAGMDEPTKHTHEFQGSDTDTQTLVLAPANQHESQYRLTPTGSPHNLRDMKASSSDETETKTAVLGGFEGSFEEVLVSKESLQRRAVSGVKDNEKDASPSDTTTAAADTIKVNESAAFLTLQRTYGTMLEMQRELFDLQQRHLAKTQAIFADIERFMHG
ncbi:hypothetical protein KC363_g3734 [Hortaea werneckii]|uniref:Uncharacterized protein n=1 Tax=Hortaea werneckii TaxID=91943 RepID=A0A3M7FRU2_HORWE|nr:hypothetical protein KC361_g4533 [Hortaea werneckii]KAI6884402.1 hypothetical protein KC325_g4328 [Hortaea werneckii]KAI6993797.1 hypothetical protein KC359_g4957 [Hortaea werneckii]KAI7145737.1 hypothetical protein KC344_g4234 [Hortaea werneckii]KAI7174420.1 hypothetical protein KC360_g4253 [Hortaea werneckii]